MSAAVLAGPARAEAVAALANMTAAALRPAAGGCSERRAQDHEQSPREGSDLLPAPVLDGAGPPHTESTRSQYGLADTAAALGWPEASIEVIDTDLGISGKWGVAREGFTELVTRVLPAGRGDLRDRDHPAGPVRPDVARLAEFGRITGTLLIDPNGVYDPADMNNRVNLGFKGTMGEALCRFPDKASSGSPFSRSKLRPWLRSVAGCTTRAR